MTNDIRKWRKAAFIHMNKRTETLRELDEAMKTIVALKRSISQLEIEHMFFGILFIILFTLFVCLTVA